jgi:type IV secretory pathway TrbD component
VSDTERRYCWCGSLGVPIWLDAETHARWTAERDARVAAWEAERRRYYRSLRGRIERLLYGWTAY